jgi:hypothetical protein
MIDKFKLIIIAVVGSIFGYLVVNWFIVPMSIYSYLLIELTISLFHKLYEIVKGEVANT